MYVNRISYSTKYIEAHKFCSFGSRFMQNVQHDQTMKILLLEDLASYSIIFGCCIIGIMKLKVRRLQLTSTIVDWKIFAHKNIHPLHFCTVLIFLSWHTGSVALLFTEKTNFVVVRYPDENFMALVQLLYDGCLGPKSRTSLYLSINFCNSVAWHLQLKV